MKPVKVLVIDDYVLPVRSMGLEQQTGGYDFRLASDQIAIREYDGRTARQGLETIKHEVSGLEGDALIFLDMGYDVEGLTLTVEEMADVRAHFGGLLSDRFDFTVGLYLSLCIARNRVLRGCVVIASQHLAGDKIVNQIDGALKHVRGDGAPPLYVVNGRGPLAEPGTAEAAIRTGVQRFVAAFGDDVEWFSRPPGYEIHPAMEWFMRHHAHDDRPEHGWFQPHLRAVRERVGSEIDVRTAKTLVHSHEFQFLYSAKSEYKYTLPASCVAALLRATVDDAPEEFQPPVIPAWPFLVAVRKLLTELKGQHHRITRWDRHSVAIVTGVDFGSKLLESHVWASGSNTAEVLDHALTARAADGQESGREVFQPLLRGTRKVAWPVYSENWFGVAWGLRSEI